MRKFKFLLAVLIILAASISQAHAQTALYKGSREIGIVKSFESSGIEYVSLEDVAALMNFSYVKRGEEIFLKHGRDNLKVVLNSAGAWRGYSLVSLASVPFENEDICWLDTTSAAALFQHYAGKGSKNILRFGKSLAGLYKTKETVSEKKLDDQIISTPENQANQDSEIDLSEILDEHLAKKEAKTKQEEVIIQRQVIMEATDKTEQPKKEIFDTASAQKDNKTVFFSGELKWIRWANSKSGNQKKILSVISVSEAAKPSVIYQDGAIHVFFKSHADNVEGIPSQFENITAEIKTDNGISELVLKTDALKIEKMLLKSPERIVLEFVYPDTTEIKRAVVMPAKDNPPANIINNEPEEDDAEIAFDENSDGEQITQVMAAKSKSKAKPKTIVIDPGHGGKDPGAQGNGIIEKNINLAIGMELGRVLRAMGYNVLMTRATDVYLTLQERTDIANNANADLFVSVHVNALPSRNSMKGFEIYIMALPTDKDALELAKIENREYVEGKGYDIENVDSRTELLLKILGDMQQNNKISESSDFAGVLFNAGKKFGLPMRRIAQAPFFVIRGSGMPAVLLETGYLTNANEAKNLSEPEYQHKIAQAMASGIASYLKK